MTLNFGNNLFPPRSDRNINFDWVDVANGLGYEVYYGGLNEGGQLLSPNIFYSETITKSAAITSTTGWVDYIDVDFDIIFSIPRNIKGDILSTIPYGGRSGSASSSTVEVRATIDVFHYDGSTETSMASTQTSKVRTITSTASNTIGGEVTTLKSNVANITHFKAGEILRFTVKIQLRKIANSNIIWTAGTAADPKERDGENILAASDTTQMLYQVPFKLDI